MSGVCPTQVWTVEGAGYTYALIVAIAYPILIALFVGVFLYHRKSSVYLRKRPLDLTLLGAVGALVQWTNTALFDVIGSERYPCWLLPVLVYLSVPMVAVPQLLKVFRYINDVSLLRLTMANKTTDNVAVTSKASMWHSFVCYLKLSFGNKTNEIRIGAARFSSSKLFNLFWLLISIVPYLIAYSARIATLPAWREGCTGCEVDTTDAAWIFAYYLFGTTSYLFLMPVRVSRRDALRILRECAVTSIWLGFWIDLAMLLHLIDPGQTYSQGYFNWRILSLYGIGGAIYIQTCHQVVVAKRLQGELLTSPNFNREDLFHDVITDKHLNAKLRDFLSSELSIEIILFMDAVEAFKRDWDAKKEGRIVQGRRVYEEFVARRAPNEINLGSTVRERIINNVAAGNIDGTTFDEAYKEIKSALMKDGFTRFLNAYKQSDWRSSKKRQSKREGSTADSERPRSKTDSFRNNGSSTTAVAVERRPSKHGSSAVVSIVE